MSLNPSASPDGELLELDQTEQEYELFDSVATEFNFISGFTIDYYIAKTTGSSDYLYGENETIEYSNGYKTRIMYDPTDETSIMDIFGISSDDTLQYAVITKSMFKHDVSDEFYNDDEEWFLNNPELTYQPDPNKSTTYKPKPGDVIRTLGNNLLYEIADVGSEQTIFQGKKLVGNLILKPYRDGEESNSAEDMLFDTPTDSEFPDINLTTESDNLSAYGNNTNIESDSNDNESYTGVDTSIYGYDTL